MPTPPLLHFYPCAVGVKAGGDRQAIHEAIRVHSMAAGALVKGQGKSNDLLERIALDPLFASVHDRLHALIDPKLFVGRAAEQTVEFLEEEIAPVLEREKEALGKAIVDGVNV
jgi:adenylosuccinate lyase